MLGVTNHSKVPLRLATMAGFAISVLSLLVAIGYLVAKLMFWDELQLGLAPLLIGIYFFGAVQLFFIGVLGEYIGSIHTQVHKRPLVVEKERINFDEPTSARTTRSPLSTVESFEEPHESESVMAAADWSGPD